MIVRSSASPLAGIPLPVTGCGWQTRTINFCFFFEIQNRKNKRHKRHTRLKALRHKAFSVWRLLYPNATNATRNATKRHTYKQHCKPCRHRSPARERDPFTPPTRLPPIVLPAASLPPVRLTWPPQLSSGGCAGDPKSTLVESDRRYRLQSARWLLPWWERECLPNCIINS